MLAMSLIHCSPRFGASGSTIERRKTGDWNNGSELLLRISLNGFQSASTRVWTSKWNWAAHSSSQKIIGAQKKSEDKETQKQRNNWGILRRLPILLLPQLLNL
ncbi:unnamed protein product [Victoria cruziana]